MHTSTNPNVNASTFIQHYDGITSTVFRVYWTVQIPLIWLFDYIWFLDEWRSPPTSGLCRYNSLTESSPELLQGWFAFCARVGEKVQRKRKISTFLEDNEKYFFSRKMTRKKIRTTFFRKITRKTFLRKMMRNTGAGTRHIRRGQSKWK